MRFFVTGLIRSLGIHSGNICAIHQRRSSYLQIGSNYTGTFVEYLGLTAIPRSLKTKQVRRGVNRVLSVQWPILEKITGAACPSHSTSAEYFWIKIGKRHYRWKAHSRRVLIDINILFNIDKITGALKNMQIINKSKMSIRPVLLKTNAEKARLYRYNTTSRAKPTFVCYKLAHR